MYVFVSDELYRLTSDSVISITLRSDRFRSVSLSPNGKSMVIDHQNSTDEIVLFSANGVYSTPLSANISQAYSTPNGEYLLVEYEPRLKSPELWSLKTNPHRLIELSSSLEALTYQETYPKNNIPTKYIQLFDNDKYIAKYTNGDTHILSLTWLEAMSDQKDIDNLSPLRLLNIACQPFIDTDFFSPQQNEYLQTEYLSPVGVRRSRSCRPDEGLEPYFIEPVDTIYYLIIQPLVNLFADLGV